MPTSEAVAVAKTAIGFPKDRVAKTIAVAATTKILVLRMRDEITALSQALPRPGGLVSSAGPERNRGMGSSGRKSPFAAIGSMER
jgi:hypothetical protein